MKFIIKFFPEITIKSKPVRRRLVTQLYENLNRQLKPLGDTIKVQRGWDQLEIALNSLNASEPSLLKEQVIEVLSNTSGIAHFYSATEFEFSDLHNVFEHTLSIWKEALKDKTFVVRCKRAGKHEFNSHEAERYIGGGLLKHSEAAGVKLKNPEITINIEIRHQRLFVIGQRYPGLGGFPQGSIESVVSLMSGGFDSTVASYLMMKRGLKTHYCFFNLGGRDHEFAVKELALFLWMKFGANIPVKFISVPFENVVGEILQKVDDGYMGVILKRMMVRGAENFSEQLQSKAIVTGEAVGQVSSQTMQNLNMIDQVSEKLVLRPLIVSDKEDIIATARKIGAEEFCANIPEYCGIISAKPNTAAKQHDIDAQENNFDFTVLDQAINDAEILSITDIINQNKDFEQAEQLSIPIHDAIILDVRPPADEEKHPLEIPNTNIEKLPFYFIDKKFPELDQSKTYLLYCDKGVMSQLHANQLLEQGFNNVKVYRPK